MRQLPRFYYLFAAASLFWLGGSVRANPVCGPCSTCLSSSLLWAWLPWIPDDEPEALPEPLPGGSPGASVAGEPPPFEPVPSPEPSTLALVALGSGAVGFAWQKWRNRRVYD